MPARNAGCKTILIDHGYHERAPQFAPDQRVWLASGGGGLDPGDR